MSDDPSMKDAMSAYFGRLEEEAKKPCEPGHPDHDDNPTRLFNWFPRIPAEIQTPKTIIVRAPISRLFMEGEPITPESEAVVAQVNAAGVSLGWPCFLRTDITSMKHGWKGTCFLADPARIAQQIQNIVVDAECSGAPFSNAIVVREMLDTYAPFRSFHGEMPITAERRYFVADGKVVCHHPYWPRAALLGKADTPGWTAELRKLNEESPGEVEKLTNLSEIVSRAIPGAWSVDWLWTVNRGWVLIDMATAGSSYHWPKCKTGERLRGGRS